MSTDAVAGAKPLVVLCASVLWHGQRLADQPLAEHLSAHANVLYVDPPISWRRAHRDGVSRGGPRLERLDTRLYRLSPTVLPATHRTGARALAQGLYRRSIRWATASLGPGVAATISSTLHHDGFGAAREARSVYWVKDDYPAGADLLGRSPRRLERGVMARVTAADEVVVASPGLVARLAAMGHGCAFIPNGVDTERYASAHRQPTPHDVELSPPIVGYLGGISDRIDVALLTALAQRGWSLLLVGPQQPSADMTALSRFLAMPNVHWLGPRAYGQLPAYLGAMTVGIVPYRTDAFNRASFPLKALEYLAAGMPVVSTDLPSMRWLNSPLVQTATTTSAFVEAVDLRLRAGRTTELQEACHALAAQHSWTDRAACFADLLGLTSGHDPAAAGDAFGLRREIGGEALRDRDPVGWTSVEMVVVSGKGRLGLKPPDSEAKRAEVRRVSGIDKVPGSLNLRCDRRLWLRHSTGVAWSGGRMYRGRLGHIDVALTSRGGFGDMPHLFHAYSDRHLRTELGLCDDDPVTLRLPPEAVAGVPWFYDLVYLLRVVRKRVLTSFRRR